VLKVQVLQNQPKFFDDFNVKYLDISIIPEKTLKKCEIENGRIRWHQEEYHHQTRIIDELSLTALYENIIWNTYSQLPKNNYHVRLSHMYTFADIDTQGIPTPEGIHQEGGDFSAIACLNCHNVSGGVSLIFDANDHSHIAFERSLIPGMQIIFSNKRFAHYTSNISPKIPGYALREVIISTFLKTETRNEYLVVLKSNKNLPEKGSG
jgi:hypothetical protein